MTIDAASAATILTSVTQAFTSQIGLVVSLAGVIAFIAAAKWGVNKVGNTLKGRV